MTCAIHGRTCSGEHAANVPPCDVKATPSSLAHVAIEDDYLVFEFGRAPTAFRCGVYMPRTSTPHEVVAKLHELIDLIDSNFNPE